MNKSKRIFTSIFSLTLFILLSSMFASFDMISNSEGISGPATVKSNYKSDYVISLDTTEKEVYKLVEDMPRFPGCEDIDEDEERRKCAFGNMLSFVYSNMNYPEEAKKANIEGTAVVQFIVNKTGQLEDIKIVRSVGFGCDEECLEVFRIMPAWIPGKQRGRAVDVQFNIPIKFNPEMELKKKELLNESDRNEANTEIEENQVKKKKKKKKKKG